MRSIYDVRKYSKFFVSCVYNHVDVCLHERSGYGGAVQEHIQQTLLHPRGHLLVQEATETGRERRVHLAVLAYAHDRRRAEHHAHQQVPQTPSAGTGSHDSISDYCYNNSAC